ncbi:MAG: elongation factor P [Alteraurantiacibacter sp.]
MRHIAFLIAAGAAAIAAPALAQDRIGTIERGTYICETPGDAAGAARIVHPALGFRIQSASRYRSPQGRGTYLREGDTITFTSGPRNGEVYTRQSRGYLRRLMNGAPSRLRCVRQSD